MHLPVEKHKIIVKKSIKIQQDVLYSVNSLGLYKWKLNFVTIFAHNLVTATEKQNNLQKRQLRRLHRPRLYEICFNLGPRVFPRARGGWFTFVYLFLWYALCIRRICMFCLPRTKNYLLFRQHMLCFCPSHGKHANSAYIE